MADVKVFLELDGKKYQSQLQETESKSKKSGETIGSNLGSGVTGKLTSAFKSLGPAIAGAAAAIGAAFTFKEMISEAAKGESALNAFNAALRAQGTFSQQASDDFAAYTSELQKVSVFGDDVIQRSAATLVSVGGLQGQALKDATKASLDFAAALDMDLGTSMDLVAKAAAGNTSALSRYGIIIDKSIPENERFAAALQQINSKFGGIAASQIDTFSGAISQARNNFGDLLEEFGKMITKSPIVREVIKRISAQIQEITARVAEFAANGDIIKSLALSLAEFGQSMVTYVVTPLELAYNIGTVFFNMMRTSIQTVIVMASNLAVALLAIPAMFSDSVAGIREGLAEFTASSQTVLGQFAQDTADSISKATTFNVADAISKNIAGFAAFAESVGPVAVKVGNEISAAVTPKPDPTALEIFTSAFLAQTKTMAEAAKGLGTQLRATFETGLTNSFAAMGAAMVKGQDAFAAFGFAIIGVLGDIALQAGATFIGLGIVRAIASLGTDPSAYALIAAGAALSVLGGALKAAAGMGGGAPVAIAASPPTPGGGGLAASDSGSVTASSAISTDLEDDNPRGRQNQVIVQIQGNVLDRRETGLEIAEILNDTLKSSGQTVIRGESFA